MGVLLKVLHQLRDAGNTIVVNETAVWVIHMGPEGGAGSGLVEMAGTPEASPQGNS